MRAATAATMRPSGVRSSAVALASPPDHLSTAVTWLATFAGGIVLAMTT